MFISGKNLSLKQFNKVDGKSAYALKKNAMCCIEKNSIINILIKVTKKQKYFT